MKKYISLLALFLLFIFFTFNKQTPQSAYAQTTTEPSPTPTPTPTAFTFSISLSVPIGSICLNDIRSIDLTVAPLDPSVIGQPYTFTASDPAAPEGTYSVSSTVVAEGNTVTLELPPASDFNNGDSFTVTFSSAGFLFPVQYTENCGSTTPTPTDTPTLTPTPTPTPLPCTAGSSYCITTQPTSMCLATGGQVELDVTAPAGSDYFNANYIPNVGGTALTFNGTVNTPLTIPIPATSDQSISIGVFFDTLGVSNSITLSNDPSACVTPTSTPTLTPIPTVTTSPLTPTDTLTPTPTPGPNQIGLSFNILLDGIGAAGDQVNPQANSLSNKTPSTTAISPRVFVYNSGSAITPVNTSTQNFTYNPSSGKYEGIASLGTAETPTDQYIIKVLVNKYLRKSFPGIISLNDNAVGNISLPDITLVSGDVDGDNALTINDYSTILDCMNSGPSYTTGIAAQADLNEDGVVDDKDLNLFLREYSVEKGD